LREISNKETMRLAIVEIPPVSRTSSSEPSQPRVSYGSLNDDHEWFVETPAGLLLDDGKVTSIIDAGHAKTKRGML
jgi:hypothetical protein